MSPTTAAVLEGLHNLPLAQIQPSPENPRKNFDPKPLAELAESIKIHGVRQPVLVRPLKGDKYQLVVGERRWRASKLAGKTEIPAIVDSKLSDSEALEIMVIENLQREDVHALDEALGYELLMKKAAESDPELGSLPGSPRHTVDSIAAKVGKSVGYVYARLKLLALTPAGREAFQGNHITAGHAVLIARLQPLDQIKALAFSLHNYRFDEREFRKKDPQQVKLGDVITIDDHSLEPEKALREWIQDNVNLRLKDVPWDLDDAELLPAAGACATCLKRSTSNPSLFGELAIKGEDTCFDSGCFHAKRDAFVAITIQADRAVARASEKQGGEIKEPLLKLSELNAYTKPKPDQAIYRAGQWVAAKPGSCPNTKPGILVRGEHAGQRKSVCIDASCKTHKHNLHAAHSSGGSGKEYDHEEENFKKHRQRVADKKKARARGVLCQEIVKRVGAKMPTLLLREVVLALLQERRVETEIVSWLLGEKKPLEESQLKAAISKADGERLNKLTIAIFLEDELTGYGVVDNKSREQLSGIAKSLKVDKPTAILIAADKAIAAAKSCRACGCTEEIPCEYWNGGKQVACSWKKDDLCSNPECATHEAKKEKAKAAK